MALTRITKGVIKPNENYDTHNINSTGIVTAIGLDVNGNADISGSLSVGGVLTYEDVTSIDSVGIITARSDLNVDGHTNLDNVSVAGVTTFSQDVIFDGATAGRDITFDRSVNRLNFADNADLTFGNSNDLILVHNGNHSLIQDAGTGNLSILSNSLYLQNTSGNETYLRALNSTGALDLYHNNEIRLSTTSDGISIPKDLDVDGHTNLDNVSIAGVSTFTGNADFSAGIDVTGNSTFSDNVSFTTANGNGIIISKSSNYMMFGNSVTQYFGGSSMWLMHNGSTGYLHNVTGDLYIRNQDSSGDVYIQGKSGEHSIICNYDGDVQLYYDGGIVAQTTQYGFQITNGALDLNNTGGSGASIRCQSVGPFYVGAAAQGDLILYCQDNTNNSVILQANTGEKYVECNMGGSVDIYHHGTKKFETGNTVNINSNHFEITSGQQLRFDNSNNNRTSEILNDGSSGNSVLTFKTNGGNRWTIDSSGHFIPGTAGAVNIGSSSKEIGDVYIADSKKILLGNDIDFQLYWDGSDGLIDTPGAGRIRVRSPETRFENWNGLEVLARFVGGATGRVELYHDNGNKKFETTATGIDVTGEVAATQDYPTIRPTLDFNFAAEKKLDPRITFYRTTTGSYIDENGDYRWASANEPKFNHDEVTHESKGLLIEPARTNKLSSGNNIPSGGNSGGTPGPSLVANNVEAPDGSFTARTIDYSNASSNMNSANAEFSWGDSAPAGKTYSASIWVKGTQGHTINFYLDASGQGSSDTGKVHTTLTGKWQRISVYHTYPSGSNTAYLRCGTRSLHGLTQGTATVVSLWGTTVVEESQPGSTIATPIVPVTTAPDYALIDGEDFTEFFNQVEGTIITSTQTLDPAGVRRPAVIEGDVTNNDRHYLQEANAYQYQIKDGGSTQAQIDAGSINTTKNIIAAAYKLNDAAVSFNGSDAATDTSATMPTCTKLKLGEWSGTFYFGHISRFMYYRNRIPNSQLKTLSSQ